MRCRNLFCLSVWLPVYLVATLVNSVRKAKCIVGYFRRVFQLSYSKYRGDHDHELRQHQIGLQADVKNSTNACLCLERK